MRDHLTENTDIKLLTVDDINLSVRAINVLKTLKANSLIEMAYLTERDFLHVKNCGKKTLTEIKQKLAEYDLFLGTKMGSLDVITVNSNKCFKFIIHSIT